MKLDQVLSDIGRGLMIRRTSWRYDMYLMLLEPLPPQPTTPFMLSDGIISTLYTFTVEDRVALDWVAR